MDTNIIQATLLQPVNPGLQNLSMLGPQVVVVVLVLLTVLKL